MRVDAIIPALNEAPSIGSVVRAIPRPPIRTVFVVDNGSTDGTAEAASAAGATVVREPRRGYGSACLAGMRALPADTDVVVFLDADGSDDPACLPRLLAPIAGRQADLVVGSRVSGAVEPGAFTVQQQIGNAVAARWLRFRFGLTATDLGPFRAIRRESLDELGMADPDYGWTVEMQIKAARRKLSYVEVPVPYRRRRGGASKVSGTLRGVVGATVKILGLLIWHDLLQVVEARSLTPAGEGRGRPSPHQ
jgi:glycosyltransferase involved in cell wall biosynthesis